MTGPDYFTAAAQHLADAETLGTHLDARDTAKFTRHMSLFEANATMARLALDAARAANLRELSSTSEVHTEVRQDRIDALHANHVAWIAAVAEGSAS